MTAADAHRPDFWGKFALVAACLGLPAFVLFRTCAFQRFNAPSTSMEPSLLKGDYFLVNKSAYGYVPAETLIGRVALVVYSIGPGGQPRAERIGLLPQ